MRRSRIPLFLATMGIALFFLAAPSTAVEQSQKRIPPGAKVYINPIDGFETYLVAGFERKKVPLVVVSKQEEADFEITGTIKVREPSKWEKLAGIAATVAGERVVDVNSEVNVAISVKNLKSGEIVFGYAWQGKSRGQQSAAEACAKHLKKKIEGK